MDELIGAEKPAAISQAEVERDIALAELRAARNEIACCDDIPLHDGLVAAIGHLRAQRDLLAAQRREHRARHKSYKRRLWIAPYRVQEWLLKEHDLLVSAQQVEDAMNTRFEDEPDWNRRTAGDGGRE